MTQQVERRGTESLLRLIAEGTAPAIGEEFFHSLVRHLAEALGVKYAFVAEFAGVKTRVRTLAFWGGGHFMDNVEYDLAGTPCEAVLAGETCLYQEGRPCSRKTRRWSRWRRRGISPCRFPISPAVCWGISL